MGIVVYNPSNPVVNAGNAPSIQEGLFAARPATAATGSIYIAWDTAQLFVYDGAWLTIGGGTSLTADNGIAINAGVIELGAALVKNTRITNGAFTFTIDALISALVTLTGQLIQASAFVPTPGLQANDILLLGGMTIYMSNAAARYYSQTLNNVDQLLYNIVSTLNDQFYAWQFNGLTQMGLVFIPGNNSYLFIGAGAGQGSTPRAVTNGDIWQRVGGGIFSQITGVNDYAGYIPASGNNSLFYNTGASGQFRWLVSKGTAGNANVAMTMSLNGRLRISATGVTTEVPSARFSVDSTTEGILIPRMTNAQMLAIASPANSLLVYNTDNALFYYWNNAGWVPISTTSVPGGFAPSVVDTGQVQNQAAGANVITFSAPTTGYGVFRINLQVFMVSFTGAPTLSCSVSYQDEINTAASASFYSMGATTAGFVPGQTLSNFPAITIVVFPGSTISINIGVGGTGTVNYNATAFIEAIF